MRKLPRIPVVVVAANHVIDAVLLALRQRTEKNYSRRQGHFALSIISIAGNIDKLAGRAQWVAVAEVLLFVKSYNQ